MQIGSGHWQTPAPVVSLPLFSLVLWVIDPLSRYDQQTKTLHTAQNFDARLDVALIIDFHCNCDVI